MTTLTALASVMALGIAPAPAPGDNTFAQFDALRSPNESTAQLTLDPPPHAPAHGRRAKDRIYDDRGRYLEPRVVRRGDRVWQGDDGRYYCRRDNGTTGLIIGAAGGALVGRAIDTRGDRTVGTLLGGALGAVLGREIDRGTARCR